MPSIEVLQAPRPLRVTFEPEEIETLLETLLFGLRRAEEAGHTEAGEVIRDWCRSITVLRAGSSNMVDGGC